MRIGFSTRMWVDPTGAVVVTDPADNSAKKRLMVDEVQIGRPHGTGAARRANLLKTDAATGDVQFISAPVDGTTDAPLESGQTVIPISGGGGLSSESDIVPAENGAIDLGSDTKAFRRLYLTQGAFIRSGPSTVNITSQDWSIIKNYLIPNVQLELESRVTPQLSRKLFSGVAQDHSAYVTNGSLYVFGDNTFGQLGMGTGIATYKQPVLASTLIVGSKVVSVGFGNKFTAVVLEDGTARAAGDNTAGQLGDGSTNNRSSFVAVNLPSGFAAKQVVCGWDHAVFLCQQQTSGAVKIFGFGSNSKGQLGPGSGTALSAVNKAFIEMALPADPALSAAVIVPMAMAAGAHHTIVVTQNGAAFGCGWNDKGQLGMDPMGHDYKNGLTIAGTVSGQTLTPLSKVLRVACGYKRTVLVRLDGSVLAVGDASGIQGASLVPVMSSNTHASGVTVDASGSAVAGNEFRAFDGTTNVNTTLWQSSNLSGSLGGMVGPWLRVQLPAPRRIASYAISRGTVMGGAPKRFQLIGSTDNATWTLIDDRLVTDWSSSATGSVTDKRTFFVFPVADYSRYALVVQEVTTPSAGYVQIAELGLFAPQWEWNQLLPADASVADAGGEMSVAVGESHGYIIRADRTLLGWGSNFYGQLGRPDVAYTDAPVIIPTYGREAVQVAAGLNHSVVVLSDNRVYTTGKNDKGQAGDPYDYAQRNFLAQITEHDAVASDIPRYLGKSSPTSMNTVYVDDDNRVFVAGDNSSMNLGAPTYDEATSKALTPHVKPAGVQYKQIVVTEQGGVALTSQSDVYEWSTAWNTKRKDSSVKFVRDISARYRATRIATRYDGYVMWLNMDELYSFAAHTFTNAGATGRSGPTLSQVRSEYSTASWAQTYVNMGWQQGIQEWTVPVTGRYLIEVAGASGATQAAVHQSRGACCVGMFDLARGAVLKIVVGQKGQATPAISPDRHGGGGGSFVYMNTTNPMIIAGGGGGVYTSTSITSLTEHHGQDTQSAGRAVYNGLFDTNFTGLPGQVVGVGQGSYITSTRYQCSGGGAGWLSDGAGSYSTTTSTTPVKTAESVCGGVGADAGGRHVGYSSPFIGGLSTCNDTAHQGGFGGGGGGGCSGSGGAGGYTGGAGTYGCSGVTLGGGGGSFNVGINPQNTRGGNLPDSHGFVRVTLVTLEGAGGVDVAAGEQGTVDNKLQGVQETASGTGHYVARVADGSVVAWGSNGSGQLGNNSTVDSLTLPKRVLAGDQGTGYLSSIGKVLDSEQYSVGQVVAGSKFSAALSTSGEVYAWGSEAVGVGGTSATVYAVPKKVTGGGLDAKKVTQIAAGSDFMLARTADGLVYAWGLNARGQCGQGNTTSPQTLPVRVKTGAQGSSTTFLENVLTISAGKQHGYALDGAGNVWTWGDNSRGQLAANLTSTFEPQPVLALRTIDVLRAQPNRREFAAAFYRHTFVNSPSNSRVYAWGANNRTQLGNNSGTAASASAPVELLYANSFGGQVVRKVSAGVDHSAAVVFNATSNMREVWTWGSNTDGRLGVSTGIASSLGVPTKLTWPALDNVIDVATGTHTLVVKADNTVYAFGNNASGQLGIGTIDTATRHQPVALALANVVRVAAANAVSLAMTNDGKVHAWGTGAGFSASPVLQAQFSQVTDIAAGGGESGANDSHVAIISNGTLYTHGRNDVGQLGVANGFGTTSIPSGWQRPDLGSDVQAVKVVCGFEHIVVLLEDGRAMRLGGGYWAPAQVSTVGKSVFDVAALQGEVFYLDADDPTKVRVASSRGPLSSTTISFIRASATSSGRNTMVMKSDGTVWGWGSNSCGVLGNGNSTSQLRPVRFTSGGLSDVVAVHVMTDVSYGYGTAAVLRANGNVHAVGVTSGGSFSSPNMTMTIYNGTGHTAAVAVCATIMGFVILRADGAVLTRGESSGINGSGSNSVEYSFAQVRTGASAFLTNITAVSSSSGRAVIALRRDGTVWTWGSASGYLAADGVGLYYARQVVGLTDVVSVAEGGTYGNNVSFGIYLKSDGTVWANGYSIQGTTGRTGDGSQTTALTQIAGLSNVVSIATCTSHCLALRNDGTVWGWGSNHAGQLTSARGVGSGNYTTAVQVSGLARPVVAIGCGGMQNTGSYNGHSFVVDVGSYNGHSFVVDVDGMVWVWGSNSEGQLGQDDTTQRNLPVRVMGFEIGDPTFLARDVIVNFTGQHRCYVDGLRWQDLQDAEGLVVVADRDDYMTDLQTGSYNIDVNDALPVVSLSAQPSDKRVLGVISLVDNDASKVMTHLETLQAVARGDVRAKINSVGEGCVWVCDQNGSLESGDYMTTSSCRGYAMRQDHDYLKNYTLAKVTMNCDFDPQLVPKRAMLRSLESGEPVLDDMGRPVFQPVMQEATRDAYYKTTVGGDQHAVEISEQEYHATLASQQNEDAVHVMKGVVALMSTKYYIGQGEVSKEEYDAYDDRATSQEECQGCQGAVNVTKSTVTEPVMHPVMIPKYKTRYIRPDGSKISKEEYDDAIQKNIPVYRCAFVGCSYHSG